MHKHSGDNYKGDFPERMEIDMISLVFETLDVPCQPHSSSLRRVAYIVCHEFDFLDGKRKILFRSQSGIYSKASI